VKLITIDPMAQVPIIVSLQETRLAFVGQFDKRRMALLRTRTIWPQCLLFSFEDVRVFVEDRPTGDSGDAYYAVRSTGMLIRFVEENGSFWRLSTRSLFRPASSTTTREILSLKQSRALSPRTFHRHPH